MEKYTCCICNKEKEGYGNNPYPLCDEKDYKSRCCDECNINYVLKARMLLIEKEQLVDMKLKKATKQ
jgi:hypothetical protein